MQINQKVTIICKNCSSKNTTKKGFKKNKLETKQKYQCKDCKTIFTLNPIDNIINTASTKPTKATTYPISIILSALSTYNLGNSFVKTSKIINKNFNISATSKTIQLWYNSCKQDISYSKIRNKCKRLYKPEDTIEEYTLLHNNLPYKFQIHKAKLDLLFNDSNYNNKFSNITKFREPIKNYLNKIPTKQFPHHIFKANKIENMQQNSQSNIKKTSKRDEINKAKQTASQLKFKTLNITKLQKQNTANKLTALALQTIKNNKERHQAVQDFFLMNDSTTIAAEIPVYLTNDDIKYFQKRNFKINLEQYPTPITGHIDLLQIRNGLIHILDYKPEAEKSNPIEQLTIYALSLASRTKLDLRSFKCAWFDEFNYYEFFPLHTVYRNNKDKL